MHHISSMIYFNVSFSQIIDNSNVKIKTLAEQTGVDRASIYQYKSGKVLPTREFLEKFISIMQLSNSEENELREAYNIAQIGVSTYVKRKKVKECLEILNDSLTDNGQTGYKPSIAQIRLPESTAEFNGREKVNKLVKNVLDYEFALANEGNHEVYIKTFIPSDYTEFHQHLSELYHSHTNTTINFKPIISFTKNSAVEDNNIIDALSSIMYFIFTGCPGYDPRFYYDENNFLDSIGILYPYYIITTKHLILLDAHLTNAQIIVDPCIINIFRNRFNAAYENTKPLIKKFPSLINITDIILSKTNSHTSQWVTCCAACGGCIDRFADDAMIAKYINPHLENVNKVIDYVSSVKQNEKSNNFTEFQTSYALSEFAKTGVMTQVQKVLNDVISPEDTKILLSNALENQNALGNIIDSSKIKIPPISFFAMRNDCLIIFIDIMSDVLIISEPEIANAFYDFCHSLLETDSVIMSPTEVTKLLKDAIAVCDRQLNA